MIEFTWKRLTQYPGDLLASHQRKKAPFSATWGTTIHALERELRHLGSRECEFMIALEEKYFRRDGLPRADAPNPSPPAVVLTFDTQELGELVYCCDRFKDWRDNVRAIQLTLERLRLAGAYGVARGEQYRGWLRLQAPGELDSTQQAAAVLAESSGHTVTYILTSDAEARKATFRIALRTAHPDTGGSREQLERVLRAGELLGLR